MESRFGLGALVIGVAAFVAVAPLAACSAGKDAAATGSAAPSPASAAASAAVRRPPSARATDPRWLRAAGDEPLERARLAADVGASELVEALDDGGDVAKTALASLPFASDADLALAPLAARAVASSVDRRVVLEVVVAIATRPRDQRDPLDPDGARQAAAALVDLAKDKRADREDRALAVSAARALAEKGWIDAAKVPTDLDPG